MSQGGAKKSNMPEQLNVNNRVVPGIWNNENLWDFWLVIIFFFQLMIIELVLYARMVADTRHAAVSKTVTIPASCYFQPSS